MGYLAALVTGRLFHLQTLQFQATANFLKNSDAARQRSAGIFLSNAGANTTRGAAWAWRTLAQALCLTPESDPLRAELRASMSANIDYYHARYVARPHNPQGWVTPYNDYTPWKTSRHGTAARQCGRTEQLFLRHAGYYDGWYLIIGCETRTITSYSGATRLATVDTPFTVNVVGVQYRAGSTTCTAKRPGCRTSSLPQSDSRSHCSFPLRPARRCDWLSSSLGRRTALWAAWVVQGPGSSCTVMPRRTRFLLRRSDAPDFAQGTGPWHKSWGEVYAATYPTPPGEHAPGALRGGNFPEPTSYWGNLQPALAYAVRFSVPGAHAGMVRMTGASNWNQFVAQANANPVWSVRAGSGA